MGSKTKIALLIPGLLAMFISISPKVAMAARNFEEGKFVEERNEAGDGRLVNDVKIPDIGNRGFGGITGTGIPGTVDIIPGILSSISGIFPDIIGFIPGITGGISGIIPGIVGAIPGSNGFLPGSGSSGIPGIGSGGIPGISGGIGGIRGGIPGIGGGIYSGGYPGQRGYRGGFRCPYGCCAWTNGYCTSCCTI
ncbi:elastin-like [Vigna radiata var. radiata]|uniref:Elastin-like n=1 Tax=Vigna radiata var. radiata TaxID=3916 RepID=A0A1S3UAI3_VIGRR|nr:elastin-like [Vigna radiata var. radiata]